MSQSRIIRHSLWLIATLIVLVLLVHSGESIEDQITIRTKSFIDPFAGFGFDAFGQIWMSAVGSNLEFVSLHVCSQEQWKNFLRETDTRTQESLCSPNYRSFCEIDGLRLSQNMLNGTVIPNADYYRFMIINCAPFESSGVLSYRFLNPGNEQLGVGNQQIPTIYMCMMALWLLLLSTWLLDWIWACLAQRETATRCFRLHALITMVILTKLSVVCVSFFYWNELSISGHRMQQWSFLEGCAFAASESGLFLVLVLVSKGWKVMIASLPREEVRSTAVALLLLLCTLLFFSFYSDGYYFLSLMILYFFMLPKIFTAASRNMHLLRAQALLLGRAVDSAPVEQQDAMRQSMSALDKKSRMLRWLRNSVVVYLLLVLVVSSMRMAIPYVYNYINYLANEMTVLVMVSFLCWLVRPSARELFVEVASHHQLNSVNEIAHDIVLLERLQEYLMNESTRRRAHQIEDMSKILIVEYPNKSKGKDSVSQRPLVIAYAPDYQVSIETDDD